MRRLAPFSPESDPPPPTIHGKHLIQIEYSTSPPALAAPSSYGGWPHFSHGFSPPPNVCKTIQSERER